MNKREEKIKTELNKFIEEFQDEVSDIKIVVPSHLVGEGKFDEIMTLLKTYTKVPEFVIGLYEDIQRKQEELRDLKEEQFSKKRLKIREKMYSELGPIQKKAAEVIGMLIALQKKHNLLDDEPLKEVEEMAINLCNDLGYLCETFE